ncbi:LPXTG cell wall anchor domain-containing protein [Micromonospora rubida]|uniref:LPXTG cell wall anchor domain-containing protein n=1 Tax=Micromonospora rubida TaxID=2697657 RepID=A0ABW7SJG4_9ACTN
MRLSRIIMALTVGLAVVVVPTAAGAAQPQPTPSPSGPQQPPQYPPQPPALTVNLSTIVVGQTVTLTGVGFGPNESVEHTVATTPLAAGLPGQAPARRSDGSTVAMAPVAYQAAAPSQFTVQADGSGKYSVRYTPSVTGRLTFTAVGADTRRTATATLTVLLREQPTPTPTRNPNGGLPVTGDSISTPLAVGGGLVGVGVVLTLAGLAWRRRNRFGTGSTR